MSQGSSLPSLARHAQHMALAGELRPELHRYCARLVGSVIDGEDVVQDAFTWAFVALDALEKDPPMRAWLFRIAHNRALDLLRSRAIRAASPIEAARDVADPESPDPVEVMMRREPVKTVVSRLQQIEKAALSAAGSDPMEQSLADANAALNEADAHIKAADSTLFALDRERDAALKADGQSAYAQAIEILTQADNRESIGGLYAKASRTAATEDDALVREIEAIDTKIAANGRQRADLIAMARSLAQRRSEIEAQRAQFYRRGYNNPMGQFSNDQVIGNVLGSILQGVQGAVLGHVLQSGYGEHGRRADSGFGGSSGFNFPGGGGFDGRGFRTGGGF